MGLGPSTNPKCKSTLCENHEQVKYVLKSNNLEHEELFRPWWVKKHLSNNESTYWACDSCIKLIKDHDLFTYDPNYVIYCN